MHGVNMHDITAAAAVTLERESRAKSTANYPPPSVRSCRTHCYPQYCNIGLINGTEYNLARKLGW